MTRRMVSRRRALPLNGHKLEPEGSTSDFKSISGTILGLCPLPMCTNTQPSAMPARRHAEEVAPWMVGPPWGSQPPGGHLLWPIHMIDQNFTARSECHRKSLVRGVATNACGARVAANAQPTTTTAHPSQPTANNYHYIVAC